MTKNCDCPTTLPLTEPTPNRLRLIAADLARIADELAAPTLKPAAPYGRNVQLPWLTATDNELGEYLFYCRQVWAASEMVRQLKANSGIPADTIRVMLRKLRRTPGTHTRRCYDAKTDSFHWAEPAETKH